MTERLFLFLQLEFPWELGPADGRYLLRRPIDREPERVIILETLGAERRAGGRRTGRRRPQVQPEPQPEPVATARATVIDPVSVSAESQARAWLDGLDATREADAATATLNRVLFAQRIATADPYVHELSPAQALVVRAGWGEGEQVAYGRWLHARELRRGRQRVRRSAALRPQERLAVLLAGRGDALLCEELALRARRDLDEGRPLHAALELDRAYAAALGELAHEDRPELADRLAELAELRPAVQQAAQAALALPPQLGPAQASPLSAGPAPDDTSREPDEDTIAHALRRLEAALRARTAAGLPD
ncbi:MAG TPA: hypothetical protein VMS02_06590 [Solirubrobacteraceae bacterium]|nr:hypothetical protein [Solirubrobacteraceae bacterium]